jgi:hypothetical protein
VAAGRGARARWRSGLVLTCLGAFAVPAAMRVLVLLAPSCCRFLPFCEIWICLGFVLFVMPSLTAIHVVGVAFVGPLIRLRFLPFSDDLALFY